MQADNQPIWTDFFSVEVLPSHCACPGLVTYDFIYEEGGTIVSRPTILANDPSSDGRFQLVAAADVVIEDTVITVKATFPGNDPITGSNFERHMTFTVKS